MQYVIVIGAGVLALWLGGVIAYELHRGDRPLIELMPELIALATFFSLARFYARKRRPGADAAPSAASNSAGPSEVPAGPVDVTLADYRAATAQMPRPTDAQCRDFVRYVSGAHSWYKHLPVGFPGVGMHFFLDPHAGMDGTHGPGARTVRAKHGEHDAALPTDEYRRRFGCLSYQCDGSLTMHRRAVPSWRHRFRACTTYRDPAGRWCAIPPEILAAGRAEITAVIDLSADQPELWIRAFEAGALGDWPAESGGKEELARIIARCRALLADPTENERPEPAYPLEWGDRLIPSRMVPIVRALLTPERTRQHEQMFRAIQRMLACVYER
jgi:hypothetical protein